jgi:hypothetical protein
METNHQEELNLGKLQCIIIREIRDILKLK